MKTRKEKITKLIRIFVNDIDTEADVILYGSRARGDQHKDSDWDILILTDYNIGLEKENIFRNKLYDLELETGESFSVFAYSKSEWHTKQKITPFYQNVSQEGILL